MTSRDIHKEVIDESDCNYLLINILNGNSQLMWIKAWFCGFLYLAFFPDL